MKKQINIVKKEFNAGHYFEKYQNLFKYPNKTGIALLFTGAVVALLAILADTKFINI